MFVNCGGDLQRAAVDHHQRAEHLVHEAEGREHDLRGGRRAVEARRLEGHRAALRAHARAETQVSVLGQNDLVYEYSKIVPKTTWKQEADGLHIRAFFAQRLQDNGRWPNPLVLKITNVQPALAPPRVETGRAVRERVRRDAIGDAAFARRRESGGGRGSSIAR